jgi:hypothetical protein
LFLSKIFDVFVKLYFSIPLESISLHSTGIKIKHGIDPSFNISAFKGLLFKREFKQVCKSLLWAGYKIFVSKIMNWDLLFLGQLEVGVMKGLKHTYLFSKLNVK